MDKRGLLHGDIAMTNITRPGSYTLGFNIRDGLPVVTSPWLRIALAISTDTPSLTELGITALNSAFTQGRYQVVLVVSEHPKRWPAPSSTIKIVAPQSFHDHAYKMRNSQVGSSHPLALLILDGPDNKSWKIKPADIAELVDEQSAVGVLALGNPDYAASLIGSLGESYQREIDKSTHGSARAPYLFPLYGIGSEDLTDIKGIPPLSPMCFAYRKTSRWERFTPNTPRHPARIRQTQFALPG